ncbi:MAG: DUF99 family protein [Haloarculaceae archaeon]
MKSGVRALGVAESYTDERSTMAGAVVRADRVVDGFTFGTCTVGGTDATETLTELFERLDRPDVRYVMVAGIAPAWFNVIDLTQVHDAVDRPVLSVSFERSEGLADDIRTAFEGDERRRRLATYAAQPARRELAVGSETVYVRDLGLGDDEAAEVVRRFTPEGGRPEPVRVARLAARAADERRHVWTPGSGSEADPSE